MHAPLLNVPFAAIASVIKLRNDTFEKQRNRNYLKEKHLYENLFEVKLKCPFDKIWEYRNTKRRSII